MLFFKNKEKLKGCFVKYSVDTAKANPEMILDAYNKKISELKKEKKELMDKIKDEYVEFPIGKQDYDLFKKKKEFGSYSDRDPYVEHIAIPYDHRNPECYTAFFIELKAKKQILKIHPSVLKKMITRINDIDRFVKQKTKYLKQITEERREFCNIFNGGLM